MRVWLPALVGLGCLLPGTASASVIEAEPGGRLVFRGAPGEVNRLVVNDNSNLFQREVTFRVSAGPVTAFPANRCLVRGTEIDCVVDGKGLAVLVGEADDTVATQGEIPSDIPLLLDGGAGADVVTDAATLDFVDPTVASSGASTLLGGEGDDRLSGGRGDDALDGGAGADRVDGGDGQDRLATRDRSADTVVCGAQDDRVVADRLDQVAADCESVDQADPPAEAPGPPGPGAGDPAPPPGDATTPPPGPRAAPRAATIRILRASRRSLRRPGLRVRVRCPGACTARLRLRLRSGRTLARSTRRLGGTGSAELRLRVRSARARRGPLVLEATVDVDGAGRRSLRRPVRFGSQVT